MHGDAERPAQQPLGVGALGGVGQPDVEGAGAHRGLELAGVPSAMTRPRSRTAIRSASWSASSRYWVVSSTVVPSATSARTMSQTWLRLWGSSPVVGSSRKITDGSPTTGLDVRSRQAMWDVVSELVRGGVTVFLTTQYLEEADQLADRIAVLDHGRLVADGTAARLKEQVGGQRLDLTLADPAAYDAAAAHLGDRLLLRDPARRTLGVATDGSAAHVRALLDEIDPGRRAVDRFALHAATLDDVFLALTGTPSQEKEQEKEAAHV
jgi:hypothetical protein